MEIKKVGVLGCGLMGSGIAQTAASAGFETVVREVSDELLQKGFAGIEKSLAKFAEKGAITAEQQKAARDRLSGTTSFAELADCDIVIEAIIENIEEKRKTYAHHHIPTTACGYQSCDPQPCVGPFRWRWSPCGALWPRPSPYREPA